MKKWLIAVFAGVFFALVPLGVLAGYPGTNIELLTRLEVTKDGSSWYNYSVETNSGGQTLDINAGDTVTFKVKMWNTGSSNATSVSLAVNSTNSQYVETANIFDGSAASNADLDVDGHIYTLTGFTPSAGTATLGQDYVAAGTVETGDTNKESGTYTTKISSSTPDQTLITVTMTVTAAEEQRMVGGLLDRAFADSSGTTVVRILVHNTSGVAQTTALPSTGKSAPAQPKSDTRTLLIASALVIISAGWIFGRVRAIKAKNKA